MPQPSFTDDFKHELDISCSSFENDDDGDDDDGGADEVISLPDTRFYFYKRRRQASLFRCNSISQQSRMFLFQSHLSLNLLSSPAICISIFCS